MADNDQEEKKFRFRNLFRSRPSEFKPVRPDEFDKTDWGDLFANLVTWAAMGLFLGGCLILSFQAGDWWITGQWTPRPLMLWLDKPPEIAAKGGEQIVLWLLDFPQSGALMLLGLFLYLTPLMLLRGRA
ncbi:MAG: hypothetical protein O7D27_08710 [Alphaproteobacteria bacterium]|nr:hypothetical protein [Alphaproteobacteria bacterium]